MSGPSRRILVVSDTVAFANNLLTWLNDAGYEPAVVTTFSAAKEHLRTAPAVLITELKLREYNGLHLALRAHRNGIPAAVIGSDPAFAGDAQEIGAHYLVRENVDRDDFLLLIAALLPAAAAHDEWDGSAGRTEHLRSEWSVESPAAPRSAGSSPGRLVVH